MNQQNPPFENNAPTYPIPQPDLPYSGITPADRQWAHAIIATPTAWESAPKAVRFAVWVWAISVIAGLALAAVVMVLFAIGTNLAILGGN